MEIVIIVVAAVLIGAAIYVYNKNKTLDVNNDGKVDAQDVKAAVETVVADVKKAADVDGDGKVTVADAKAAVKKTKAKAKTAVKEVAKKANTRGRKPAAK
jgi:hypothetical protein